MSDKWLIYDGIKFSDYGCYYDGAQIWKKPQKKVTFYSIPGRSGDLSITEGAWENVQIPVNCYIKASFSSEFNSLVYAISQVDGYKKLYFGEDSSYYRLAQVTDEIVPVIGQDAKDGQFEIVFNCMPGRYYDDNVTELVAATRGSQQTDYNQYSTNPSYGPTPGDPGDDSAPIIQIPADPTNDLARGYVQCWVYYPNNQGSAQYQAMITEVPADIQNTDIYVFDTWTGKVGLKRGSATRWGLPVKIDKLGRARVPSGNKIKIYSSYMAAAYSLGQQAPLCNVLWKWGDGTWRL